MRIAIFTAILCIQHAFLFAQPSQISFNHYGIDMGFTAKEALNMAQENNGMLWIASNNGLAKFDSKRFTFYQHNSFDSTTVTNNLCKKIMFDTYGKLWVISYDDLDILETSTGKFLHLKLTKNGNKTAIKPKYLFNDSLNNIMWVGTKQGLYYCNTNNYILHSAKKITTNKKIINDRISTIVQESKNILWISSSTNIIKLNIITGETIETEIPIIIDNINNTPDQGNILGAYFSANKHIYYGTWCRGLIEFNTITRKFHQYKCTELNAQENTIQSITITNIESQKNIIWLSTFGAGLCAFNTITKKITSYRSNIQNNPTGIKGNLYGLYATKNALWIGSETGLHCYNYNRQYFSNIDITSIAKNKKLLPISDIAIERNNNKIDEKLWFHIPYNNAFCYNLKNNIITNIPTKLKKYVRQPTTFLTWYIDCKNTLWISTTEYGLIAYDIATDKLIVKEQTLFYKEWQWVTEIYEDNNNELWLGTYNGLFKKNKNTFESIEIINSYLEQNKFATTIMSITQDEQNNIWCTADNSDKKNASIIKYNANQNKFLIVYNEKTNSKNYNPQVELRTICSDKKGKIFVTFFNENIQWFNSNDTNSKRFNILDKRQGLNSYFIDQLKNDTVGKIWLTNTFGIACYKPNENVFTNFNLTEYGLDVDGNPLIYFSPNTHKLYVGQSNKICVMNTNMVDVNEENTNLVINQMKIADNIYSHKLINGSIIELKYKQNFISIDFALLSYTNSEQNTYAWYLQGLETEWQISKNNIASYTNLQPGKYTLYMKAANSNGKWTKPITLTININPPFYKTWWFLCICAGMIISAIYYLVQLRINRIKERFALRNKIASDLHDEIGSTLTSISILSKVSQQAMDKQPLQAKQMMEQISLQSKTIQQNMSDIVWSIRPDNEKIEDLLIRMREYASQTLEPLNITFSLQANDLLVEKILPMFFRKDVLLIFKEAINNIAKHAEATTANVIITNANKIIQLIIKDNGIWKGNNSGTGTKTMQERAKAIGGTITIMPTEKGTQIILRIPIP